MRVCCYQNRVADSRTACCRRPGAAYCQVKNVRSRSLSRSGMHACGKVRACPDCGVDQMEAGASTARVLMGDYKQGCVSSLTVFFGEQSLNNSVA